MSTYRTKTPFADRIYLLCKYVNQLAILNAGVYIREYMHVVERYQN